MELLISQKNKVFNLIEKYNFSPNEFKWQTKENKFIGKRRYIVRYKNSNYYFIFDLSEYRNGRVEYSPGSDKKIEKIERESSYRFTFEEQLVICKKWLGYLKREVEYPDKWEQLFGEEEYFKSGLDEEENSKFSYEEVKRIENSVSQLKEGVIKLGLKESERQEINQKLDYLVKKSKVLGRIDWKNIAIGTFMGMIGQLSLQYPKEIVVMFVEIIKASFKTILLLN